MIFLKQEQDIASMRIAGRILAGTLEYVRQNVAEGKTTAQLNAMAEAYISDHGALPSFKGYNGFPAAICTSVNEEVVHGIPGKRILKNGDIISIDVGVIYDGWHTDAANTFPVGEIPPKWQALVDAARESFYVGLSYVKAGARLSDVSHAIQTYVEQRGFGVVRVLCGHGVGRNLHEDPEIPNFGAAGRGVRLQKGMTLAIEPMITLGTYQVSCLSDGWTIVTADKKPAAHYEHTVAVTDGEAEILTLP